jgi:hypothetical protein
MRVFSYARAFRRESAIKLLATGNLCLPLTAFASALFDGSLLREQNANPADERLEFCSFKLALGHQLLDPMSFRLGWIDVRNELASLPHPGQYPRVVATVSDWRLLVPGNASDRMGLWPK